MNLLLLSSSRVGDTDYLLHAEKMIQSHLKTQVKKVLFVPYAGITINHDEYESMAAKAFEQFGYQLESIHHKDDPVKAIENAEAIAVGGGNTFCLLNSLYENQLIQPIQEKVKSGTPYIGWSAGSNMAAPTIRTTNDMPIIEPPSFNALNLVPFQINPHYIDGNPPGHNGETREQRIAEFLVVNPEKIVVGIPEGTAIIRHNDQLTYSGEVEGFLFDAKQGKSMIKPNADLSYLLK